MNKINLSEVNHTESRTLNLGLNKVKINLSKNSAPMVNRGNMS